MKLGVLAIWKAHVGSLTYYARKVTASPLLFKMHFSNGFLKIKVEKQILSHPKMTTMFSLFQNNNNKIIIIINSSPIRIRSILRMQINKGYEYNEHGKAKLTTCNIVHHPPLLGCMRCIMGMHY